MIISLSTANDEHMNQCYTILMSVADNLTRALNGSGVLGHGHHICREVTVSLKSVIAVLDDASRHNRYVVCPVA